MTSRPSMSRAVRLLAGIAAMLVVIVWSLPSPPAAGAAIAPVGWLHTSGSKILTAGKKTHTIKAVSWFGLETSNCAPHGLWQISMDTGLAQIASFGFNTIRLPFSNECLAATSPTSIDYTKNPELEGKTPLQVMDVFIVKARQYGLSVILDRHRPDSSAQSPLWYTATYSQARWISDWKMLASRYRGDSTVIGVDLHNEPHGTACWGCADPDRDWAAAATRAGNAVLSVNPKLLIIVEGIDHQAKKGDTWWGGGLADAAKKPIKLKVAHRLVYSSHDYPASLFAQKWFSAKNYPANLAKVWTTNWGYLQRKRKAPVLLGEFGTKLETTSDQQWLATLVAYVKKNKMSFAYWSFNPNSGDTGGLVEDDWVTPQTAKLAALRPILGPAKNIPPIVRPTPTPTPTVTVSPSPEPTSTPTTPPPAARSRVPAGQSQGAGELSADWHLNSSWGAGYVAEVKLTASTARSGWTMSWDDPSATSVANAWGMSCAAADGRITCRSTDWAQSLAAGQTVTVGLQVNSPGSPPSMPTLTIS